MGRKKEKVMRKEEKREISSALVKQIVRHCQTLERKRERESKKWYNFFYLVASGGLFYINFLHSWTLVSTPLSSTVIVFFPNFFSFSVFVKLKDKNLTNTFWKWQKQLYSLCLESSMTRYLSKTSY